MRTPFSYECLKFGIKSIIGSEVMIRFTPRYHTLDTARGVVLYYHNGTVCTKGMVNRCYKLGKKWLYGT